LVGQNGFFEHTDRAIHYLERGRGEPLVLIHGLGSSGADWALQVPSLEERCRLIVPDLPGSGHSEPLRAGYSVEGMAAALWSLCDHLAVGRVHIVGFSLGGAVGLEMALQRPEQVSKPGAARHLDELLPGARRLSATLRVRSACSVVDSGVQAT
jgi:pimeloyl-ACP methyl ester carboxylesterase